MDDKNTSQLLDGVGMEDFGGIASIWLMAIEQLLINTLKTS